MSVRPFDWRDIPTLHRYRHSSVFLDSELVLTRGPMQVQGALISYLAPGMGVVTCVGNSDTKDSKPVIGQFTHAMGSQFAHLSFLTPEELLDTRQVSALLDYMVAVSGERGALRLLADVDEGSGAFEALRRDGFSTFSRQRIWKWETSPDRDINPGKWRKARSADLHAVRSLYKNVVPGLVQQVEPGNWEQPSGVVYYQGDDLLAYANIRVRYRGVWLQPYFHPDVDGLPALIVDLLGHIPEGSSRPLYICVRSYQSWLESTITELGAQAGPPQVLMVRHLAKVQKAEQSFALPALEGGSPEVTAPIVRSEGNHS